MNHSMSCPYPEGCSCGATAWNRLARDRDAHKRRALELEKELSLLKAGQSPTPKRP